MSGLTPNVANDPLTCDSAQIPRYQYQTAVAFDRSRTE